MMNLYDFHRDVKGLISAPFRHRNREVGHILFKCGKILLVSMKKRLTLPKLSYKT